MSGCNGEGAGINSFALVSYLPDPLAAFLDGLRKELESECRSRAHVTVLPPRPLECDSRQARGELIAGLQDFQPFLIELGGIQIFPVTNVIYVSVVRGGAKLEALHARLNRGSLAFEEPFRYHPHVTLAQELEPHAAGAVAEIAAARWRDFPGERAFVLDRLTFVQNTLENRWTDLRAFRLAARVPI
jgi:2'-5' RNA ligase